jgi:ribosomal protein S18 acetylase RimI-like enzyme
MEVLVSPFEMRDYPVALALWKSTEGVGLSSADESAAIEAFLLRNPSLSFKATIDGQLVGTILCGDDGRRGLIHHLVTAESHRRCGVAKALLQNGLRALRGAGIEKCHLLVFKSNGVGVAFWRGVGAQERVTLSIFSIATLAGS